MCLWALCVLSPGCHAPELVVGPSALRASFGFALAQPGALAADAQSLGALFAQAEQALPPKVKQRIGRSIVIDLDGDRAHEQIQVPACAAVSTSDRRALEPPQTLASARFAASPASPHRILLHPGVLLIARQGPEGSARFACGHGSLYRLAVATLVHEVVHIYDHLTRLSANPAYQHMQQFARQDGLRKLKAHNHLRMRSPDIYEFYNISENLAVNVEYFLLDPDYQCRRPSAYQFLSTQMEHRPFPGYSCAVNTLVYAGNQPTYVDPARVYQIHYLFAASGKGIASRFGHSMFRIVSCAPTRTRVDASCLEDLHDQVVLSFVANLRDDLTLSSWKGLTGGYMSQLIIRPLTEILNDYTEIDYRDLQSIPLQLSADEMRQFIYHALELYWGYSGRYFFLTNNCADESLRLLQTVLPGDGVQRLEVLTPLGLRDTLINNHVADSSVLKDRADALNRGYLFKSALERYEQVYAQFRDALPAAAPRKLDSYLRSTKPAQRRAWAGLLLQRPATLSGLFTVEGLILQRLMKDIERSVLSRVLFQSDPRYVELGQRLKEHLNSLRLPWELVQTGYGVPLPREFALEPRDVRPPFPEEILTTALSLIKTDNAKLYDEYVQTEQNRKLMLSYILKTSAAGMGERP